MKNSNYNIDNINNINYMNNSSSLAEINFEISSNKNQNEEVLNNIVENFINKKLLKENEHKYQIEQTKKSILEKFYLISNNDCINQQNKKQLYEAEFDFNQQNKNIPKINQNQKEYEEIKEKYKNERNKKKSSIFKSEDLHVSNTDIVHIKKEDYSPINPNVVDIENKNNIIILQKKLFGENDNNEDGEEINNGEKIEDIDEIELDFSEINNNKYEESEIICSNCKKENIESENNINKKNNEEINNNFRFSNDILLKKREIDLCFLINNKKNKNLKEINKFLRQKQKSKNFSVQLVSSIGYLNNNKREKIENNSFSNNIIYFNNENSNQINLNYLTNNKIKQNFISDYNSNYINGKYNNKENSDNDNSNNTIIQMNNNNYNGKYYAYDNKKINGSNGLNINYKDNNYNNQKNKSNKEYRTFNRNNNNKNKILSYLDNKNFSSRFSLKKDNKISPNNYNFFEKKLNKPKILKKKNNSFILNRDIGNNNKILNKPVYKTMNNKINSIFNNKDNINSKKNLLSYNNVINCENTNNNKIIPIISKMPISIKFKKNELSKLSAKNPNKENLKKIGNKIALLNTLLNNSLILFQKVNHKKEAIEKLKTRPNNGVYFIYVDKVNDGYSFKGIYKRGPSEINHICNKIFGIQNTPLILSYEKFYILVENEDKNFEFKKLKDINVLSFVKTILLIKNK